MLVRALIDHYDPQHCRRTAGQVYDYVGTMHKHIAPMPAGAEGLVPQAPASSNMPSDVRQRLEALKRAPTSEPVDPHLTPTPVKGHVEQLPSGALPPDLVPLPPSMPTAPIPAVTTAVDDGRDLLG
ncbi:MAG: hypothetical protein KA129_04525 [Microthrixaceae bacterium]|nr:hypothetical protein [Microthrixaceae bacterium]